ncbi:phosphopantetheine-binding protein, partial [Lysinibacillus sp. NPDC056185]|uniref:phosphopantetheine-binding protein n=1 Tax=Lysinibacillus sp. NPDC056185 TaxID=3345739 RepID=UPI0039EE1DFE
LALPEVIDGIAAHAADAGADVPPDGPAQELMAELWCELLGTERVGAAQNFFRLGGTSLLAARLVAAVHDAFDIALPLHTVFEQPTVAGLTAAVEDAIRAELAELDDAELAAATDRMTLNEEHSR